MIGNTVNDQLGYLTSSERRFLRNYQSGNGNDADVQVILSRITNPVGSTSEGAKGSENIERVRRVIEKLRNGSRVSLASTV